MKRQTATLLRHLLRLIERDVTELADAVVQIDEREAKHASSAVTFAAATRSRVSDLDERVDTVERIMREHLAMHVDTIEHSRRGPSL